MGAFSKQVIIVRKDLKMSKGKMAAQVSHASMGAFFNLLTFTHSSEGDMSLHLNTERGTAVQDWIDNSFTKVVLEVETKADLEELKKMAYQSSLPFAYVVDEGRTEFTKPEATCLGIGPGLGSDIDEITGHLKLYREKSGA